MGKCLPHSEVMANGKAGGNSLVARLRVGSVRKMHCFICNLLSESLHLNEHEAATWLNLENLRSLKWLPADEILLDKITEYLN